MMKNALLAGLVTFSSLGLFACGDASPADDASATKAATDSSRVAATAGTDGAAAPAQALRAGTTAAEAMACQQRIDSALVAAANSVRADTTRKGRIRHGENPVVAVESGWPVKMPPMRDEVILPCKRIIAYYGNPLQKRMGVLGEYPKDEMLSRFRRQVAEWNEADPAHPVQPALHMVAIVAQGDPGTSGHYRTIMRDTVIEETYAWAKEAGAILIVDIQVGTDNIRNLLPRMEKFLLRPDVHLGIDPEFMMKDGSRPGAKIGTMDAADINYASEYLAKMVREHNLPPKVLVIHRFTDGMVTNVDKVELRPEVQLVLHMDGWGRPFLKRDTYRKHVQTEPLQYTGFKLFYHHDTREDPLMKPADLMRLWPKPLYIQYQ